MIGIFGLCAFSVGDQQPEVAVDRLGRRLLLEIVGPDQDDDGARVQVEDVLLQADEDAARGVAADAAVGDLDAGEHGAEAEAPPLRDRVAEEHDRALIALHLRRPHRAALLPQVLEPLHAPDRPGAGQPVVRRGDREGIGRRRDRGDRRGRRSRLRRALLRAAAATWAAAGTLEMSRQPAATAPRRSDQSSCMRGGYPKTGRGPIAAATGRGRPAVRLRRARPRAGAWRSARGYRAIRAAASRQRARLHHRRRSCR